MLPLSGAGHRRLISGANSAIINIGRIPLSLRREVKKMGIINDLLNDDVDVLFYLGNNTYTSFHKQRKEL